MSRSAEETIAECNRLEQEMAASFNARDYARCADLCFTLWGLLRQLRDSDSIAVDKA